MSWLLAASCSSNPTLLGCAQSVGGGGRDLSHGIGGLTSTVADVIIYVIGGAAVLMLIIGGLRYVLSGGDPQATKNAKNTILYALVGVAVALAALGVITYITGHI